MAKGKENPPVPPRNPNRQSRNPQNLQSHRKRDQKVAVNQKKNDFWILWNAWKANPWRVKNHSTLLFLIFFLNEPFHEFKKSFLWEIEHLPSLPHLVIFSPFFNFIETSLFNQGCSRIFLPKKNFKHDLQFYTAPLFFAVHHLWLIRICPLMTSSSSVQSITFSGQCTAPIGVKILENRMATSIYFKKLPNLCQFITFLIL